jgi:uncharacterized protein (DUF983 family)
MKECVTQSLKVNESGKNSQKLFNTQLSYKYECQNCGNKLHEKVITDFLALFSDDKLVCPLCMSLKVREVKK